MLASAVGLGVVGAGLVASPAAVYLNLTIVRPAARGWAQAYSGPDRPVDPPTSTVNFVKGQTLANAAFIGTSVGTNRTQFDDPNQPPVESYFIKIYTNALAWVVVDATGGFSTGRSPLDNPNDEQSRSPAAGARSHLGKYRSDLSLSRCCPLRPALGACGAVVIAALRVRWEGNALLGVRPAPPTSQAINVPMAAARSVPLRPCSGTQLGQSPSGLRARAPEALHCRSSA